MTVRMEKKMTKDTPYRKPWRLWPLAAFIAIASIVATSVTGPAFAAEVTVFKSPWCGCCMKWIDHMRANGHSVHVKNMENLDMIKKMAGVPERLQSCHTAMVSGYAFEGHVPAKDIARLLTERPRAKGLALTLVYYRSHCRLGATCGQSGCRAGPAPPTPSDALHGYVPHGLPLSEAISLREGDHLGSG